MGICGVTKNGIKKIYCMNKLLKILLIYTYLDKEDSHNLLLYYLVRRILFHHG